MNKRVFLIVVLFSLSSLAFGANTDHKKNNHKENQAIVFFGDVASNLYSFFDAQAAYRFRLVSKGANERHQNYRKDKLGQVDSLYPKPINYEQGKESVIAVDDGAQTSIIPASPLLIDISGNHGYFVFDTGSEIEINKVPMQNIINPTVNVKTGLKKISGLKKVKSKKYYGVPTQKNYGGITDIQRRLFMYNVGAQPIDNNQTVVYRVAYGTPTSVDLYSEESSSTIRHIRQQEHGVGFHTLVDGEFKPRAVLKCDGVTGLTLEKCVPTLLNIHKTETTALVKNDNCVIS